jgi:hypothetical protein
MVRSVGCIGLCAALLSSFGCKPELEGRPSQIDGPRVLAVRSTPADAKPAAEVSYDALFVDIDGLADPEPLDWGLCTSRKALTEPGTISPKCRRPESSAIEGLGTGGSVMGTIPKDACSLFGPSPQTPKPGEPATRPEDPDTTGGYYQPVRLLVPSEDGVDEYSVGVTRLSCGVGGATQEQTATFNKRAKPNENPALDSVTVRSDGEEFDLPAIDADEVHSVSPSSKLKLVANWASCPTEPECGDGICSPGEDNSQAGCPDDCMDPHGCTGSEPYLYFDPVSRKLVDRREAIRVSWYATAGSFEHERTGRTEEEAGRSSSANTWTAPKGEADVKLWVVIRDDRGGVGWGSYALRVE